MPAPSTFSAPAAGAELNQVNELMTKVRRPLACLLIDSKSWSSLTRPIIVFIFFTSVNKSNIYINTQLP